MSTFGYNILSETPGLWEHLERLKPSALLFLNGAGGAQKAASLFPQCKVIHRVHQTNEDTLHRTPGATLAYLQARVPEVNRSVLIGLSCEPQIPTDDDLKRLNDEQLKALVWAKANGIKVAALHLAHYGIDGLRWRIIEPLISFIADNPSLFLFTCDEYAAGHMFSGVVDPSLTSGNEIGHIQPETWRASPVPKYWHCGRITDYFRDRQARGLNLPLTVITEHGLDALGDVTAWRNSLLKTQGYSDIRGWKSLRAQHEAWYGARGWSAERAYFEMLAACWREIYAPFPNILGALIYCYGTNNDAQWNQFRVDGALEFQQRLEAFQIGVLPLPTPIPDTPEAHARLKTLSGTTVRRYIRTETNSDSTALGYLNIGDEVYWHPSPPAPSNGGWVYVRKVVGNISGWMSIVAGVTFETIVDTLPDSAEVALLKAQVATLTTQLATATTANAALQTANTTLVATLENREAVMAEAARDTRALDGKLEEIFISLEAHTETLP